MRGWGCVVYFRLTRPCANVDVHGKALPLVNQSNWSGLKFINHVMTNHKILEFYILLNWYMNMFLLLGLRALSMTNLDTQWIIFHSIKAKNLPEFWHVCKVLLTLGKCNIGCHWLLLYPRQLFNFISLRQTQTDFSNGDEGVQTVQKGYRVRVGKVGGR